MDWVGIFKIDQSSRSGIVRDYDVTWSNQYGVMCVKHTKGKPTGRLSARGYWEVSYLGKLYKVHRIIWELSGMKIPTGMFLDHIDGNRSNNLLSNLRLVDNKSNCRNTKKSSRNKTGTCGVSTVKKNNVIVGYRAVWVNLDGQQQNKQFIFSKFGEELSEFLAIEYRLHQIHLLNLLGAGYTDRHGG